MSRRALGLVTIGVLLAGVVSACSDDKPPICSSVDALKSSVQNLRDVQVQQGAVSEIKSDAAEVKSDFDTLKSEAKGQYSTEIAALNNALVATSNSANKAAAAPSGSALLGLTASVKSLGTATSALTSAVKNTC